MPTLPTLGPLPLWLLGLPAATLFLTAGIGHFREPAKFVGIMKGMPLERWHPAANYITGAAELWLGAELAIAPLLGAHHASQIARALFWLVLLMSPANFNMWYNDVPFGDQRLTYGWTGTHALRCALQVLLLAALHFLRISYEANASSKDD